MDLPSYSDSLRRRPFSTFASGKSMSLEDIATDQDLSNKPILRNSDSKWITSTIATSDRSATEMSAALVWRKSGMRSMPKRLIHPDRFDSASSTGTDAMKIKAA
jgi:hypothetical protein